MRGEEYLNRLEGKTALFTVGLAGLVATPKEFVNEAAYTSSRAKVRRSWLRRQKEIGRLVTGIQRDVSNLGDLDRLYAQIKQEKGMDAPALLDRIL